ncbi:amphi-Trp domain-containing protein [Desulfotomaculum arcticum]|uniref:Amphi-Trp domain-containing protein n=1 Tax=Desulfotruncus arcticus DSM 17038 TaxID=1121424 RepID=A0A1I2N5H9_9FIRM|nr:hypothetical protein [Desulfotruncus arcticus]SFF98360.1 amphi-Trp domain-containing protein [Desulfotomaculum arcticum] [Desulfotruncus arcticus DSM 17038]
MDYSEKYVGSKAEFMKFMQEVMMRMASRSLTVEDGVIEFPEDVELEYKIKYDEDEEERKLSIKVCWPNPDAPVTEEDAEE